MADVYASRTELSAVLGGTITGADDRLDLALLAASRWVEHRVGLDVTEADLVAPYTLTVVACPPSWKAATLAAAVRFFKAADAPWGVAGVGELAAYIKTSMPDVELLLMGQRQAFGIA